MSYSVTSHFPCFSGFLSIFKGLPCVCPIFHVFQYSRHIPCPRVCISYFPLFSVFSPYSRSYSVCVSFCMFFNFLAIFQVLQSTYLIYQVFHCFSQNSRSSLNVSSSFSKFFSFLSIYQVLDCKCLIFEVFQCFSTYSRS
jgi:hypothetical protein